MSMVERDNSDQQPPLENNEPPENQKQEEKGKKSCQDYDNEQPSPTSQKQTPHPQHHYHYKMYKPSKVLTQFVFTHRKRKNRTLLGDVIQKATANTNNNNNNNTGGSCISNVPVPLDRIMAIGRLDENSEGLLLLTTDGKVSNRIREHSSNVTKEYYVQVDGQITKEAIDKLQRGVDIRLNKNNAASAAASNTTKNKKEQQQQQQDTGSTIVRDGWYTTLPCKAKILDTIQVEHKAIIKGHNNTTPNHNHKQQTIKKNKKIKLSCNKCGMVGHKAKECEKNRVGATTTTQDDNNNNNNFQKEEQQVRENSGAGIPTTSEKNEEEDHNHNVVGKAAATTTMIALPAGIPLPSNRTPIRDEKRHGPTSWISITITEGKNRQVRKMTAAVGFPTLRLIRVRIGNITLEGIRYPGMVQQLQETEIVNL